MYCCCGWKISNNYLDGCKCDWFEWTSVFDWPLERKNKKTQIGNPLKDGQYYVRCQTSCGDRYEEVQTFSVTPREEICGYTGRKFQVYWSGDDESQPYAWRKLREGDEI